MQALLFLSCVPTNGLLENINPLSANPTKWPNTLKQFVGKLPTNCLSVLGHFINLALKGLMRTDIDATSWGWRVKDKKLELTMMRNESQTNIFNMLNKYLLSLNFLIHPYFSSFSLCL